MWDNEVDEAARAMTSGEPGGDLKAHVLARLDERPPTRRFTWVALAAPVAALALLVALRGREVQRVQEVQTVQPVQEVQRAQGVQEIHKVQGVQQVPQRVRQTATPPAADESVMSELAPVDVEPVIVEAMPQPNAIAVDRLETPPPIELDEIEMTTLAQ